MGYDLHAALHEYTGDLSTDRAPVDEAAVLTRVRRGRARRAATTGLASAAAVTVIGATAFAALGGTGDPAPVAPATAGPTAAVEPAPDRTPAPAPAPTPVPAPAPVPSPDPVPEPSPTPTGPPAVAQPVFRTGGRVAHFPTRAPEAEVVAYLTQSLDVQPEVEDAAFACPPGMVPGRILEWPGTGVGLRVRTADDAGGQVEPFVAAWTLTEPAGTLGLATESGLTAGAPRDRVVALHPDAEGGDLDLGGMVEWWYSVSDAGGDLLVLGTDDGPVYRVESGEGCGE